MASAELSAAAEPDWAVSNPWPWMGLAVACGAGAFTLAAAVPDAGLALPLALLLGGLLACSGSLWMRFGSASRAAVDRFPPPRRSVVCWAVSLGCWAIALAVTAALAARLAGESLIPWSIPELLLAWILVAPWAATLGRDLGRVATSRLPASDRVDGAALCLLAALVAFVGSWALYFAERSRDEFDSMRLFLAAGALAGLIGSYVAGLSDRWRFRLVSALIVFHISGVIIFCVQHPPGPWALQQAWIRLYRPYMDFMFLSNAYRFYAPDPNPASQLWCLVEYDDPPGKPVRTERHWVFLPDLDASGRPNYPLGIQYQRRIAMAEYAARAQAQPPALYTTGPDGRHKMADYYRRRDDQSPFPQHKDKLGHEQVRPQGIPYHPDPTVSQYQPTDPTGHMLLETYARRVCRTPHPDAPELKATAVKIYRVLHRTLTPQELAAGADPHDWTLFLPYYMGKYAPDGTPLDRDGPKADPFLYWLLPMRRENPTNPASPVLSYVHQHARGFGGPEPLPPRRNADRRGDSK